MRQPPEGRESEGAVRDRRERTRRAAPTPGGSARAAGMRPPGAGADPEARPSRGRRPRPKAENGSGGEPQRRLSVCWAEQAAVCGALGCRETEALLEVTDEESGEQRVLCPSHAADWGGVEP